MAQYTEMI